MQATSPREACLRLTWAQVRLTLLVSVTDHRSNCTTTECCEHCSAVSFDLILSLWVPTRIMQDVFICTQIDDCAGKTLCAMSPHLLEQHTLPDEPAMQTAHTDADLEKSREVWVGKRYPKDPDRERLKKEQMYRGFKQLDDGNGTIVPDGSVSTSTAAAATAECLRILSANIGQEVNDQCCMRYLQRAA